MLFRRQNYDALSYQEQLCNYINRERYELHSKGKKAKNLGTVLKISRDELFTLHMFEPIFQRMFDVMIRSRKVEVKCQ